MYNLKIDLGDTLLILSIYFFITLTEKYKKEYFVIFHYKLHVYF